MTAPTWLRILRLTLRLKLLFLLMGLETDQGRRDEAWLLICKVHADRAVLRAGRGAP